MVTLAWTTPVFAQEAAGARVTGDRKAEARTHFQEGLALAQRGELARAVAEFEAAYAASPHHSVLFNIAQTEAARGRFVQAVGALERYLSSGGQEISASRRDAVTKLLAQYRSSIGNLTLDVEAPANTRIWLDGAELERVEGRQTLPLTAGSHVLIYVIGRSAPVVSELAITGGSTTSVRLQGGPPAPDSALGLTCSTPDVSVSLDGAVITRTPVNGALPIVSGEHRLKFGRAGYLTSERVVRLKPGGFVTVDCDVHVDPRLEEDLAATLTIRTSPAQARTTLDGNPLTSSKVPIGPHDLLVEHDGYFPYRRRVSLEPHRAQRIDVVLTPTPAKLRRERAARSRRQNVGLGLGGSGIALLLGSAGLAWWNQGRFDDLQRASGGANPDPNGVIAIQRVDDLSIALAVSGVGLLLGGAWAYWGGDSGGH